MIIHNELPIDKQNGTLIFLQKPMKRIVCETYLSQKDFVEPNNSTQDKKYFISLPYVLFSINYCIFNELIPINLSVGFATNDQLEQIYMPTFTNIGYMDIPIPNIIGSKVCLKLNCVGKNPDDLAKQVVDTFWKQRFNHENTSCLWEHCMRNNLSPLNTLKKWQTKTKEDPNWIPTENDMTLLSSYQDFKDVWNKIQKRYGFLNRTQEL